jgi:hypothetical protein
MSGKLTLISSATASDSASVEFTSGIDSTYDEYVFYFVDVSPSADEAEFSFQVNADGQSGFNETMTTTFFNAKHDFGGNSLFGYIAAKDQAQGTSYQTILYGGSADSDDGCVGELHLFGLSSTSKVKHFYSRVQGVVHSNPDDYSEQAFCGGYINTTSAIDEVSFKMSSGNFDGNIYLFGVS